MQIAAAVMFKLRSFEPASGVQVHHYCDCIICRWIPCYVFVDTLVVNIMGVTAVTSLYCCGDGDGDYSTQWRLCLMGCHSKGAVLCWSVEALEIIFQYETFLMGGWVYAQI